LTHLDLLESRDAETFKACLRRLRFGTRDVVRGNL